MIDEKIFEIDQAFMAPLFWKRPIAVEYGKGAHLYDSEGKKYLDFTSNYGVAITGHCHPTVVHALQDQAEKLISCHSSFYNQSRSQFIEKLSEMAPKNLNKYYFSNSGTEAVESALKFARKSTGKKGFVAMMNCFHGKTMGSLSLTWNKKYREPFMPLLQDVTHVPFGKADRLLDAIGPDTAAVILEPIQGESGVNIPPEGYLKEVRDICSDKGVLLILDEIQTGTGRTGRFFAVEHSRVQPDIVCLSKALASGFPLGATLCSEQVASALKVGDHSSTFGGNPLACAAGRATLEIIQRDKLIDKANEMGDYLIQEMRCLTECSIVREVRGKGLMLAVEMKFDALNVMTECMKRGLLVLDAGRNIIRMLPPLIISKDDADQAVQILKEAIGEEEYARKSSSTA